MKPVKAVSLFLIIVAMSGCVEAPVAPPEAVYGSPAPYYGPPVYYGPPIGIGIYGDGH